MTVCPLRGLLITVLSAGILTWSIGAVAQDDPFASATGGETGASPFDMPEGEGEDASPFAPTFGIQPETEDPFQPETEDPFQLETEDPFQPETDDPFSAESGSEAAADFFSAPMPGPDAPETDMPFGAAPAPSVNPFGVADTSPFDTFGETTQPPSGATATGGGIATLYEFRYMNRKVAGRTTIVVRQMMTMDEAEEWDRKVKEYYRGLAEDGKLAHYTAGQNDLDDWADWMLYADQVDLWLKYCNQVALVGLEPEVMPEDIVWPGDPKEDEEGEEVQARPGRPANIINENRSLDDQLADFNPVPDTRSNQQAGISVIDPQEMNDRMAVIYDRVLQQLRSHETDQQLVMAQLDDDLTKREQRREAYNEWRESQKEEIIEFVDEWSRRYEGKVVMIAGVRYELYRPGTVPSAAPRGTNIVETDFDLTPYDLLNEDGTLRGPAR